MCDLGLQVLDQCVMENDLGTRQVIILTTPRLFLDLRLKIISDDFSESAVVTISITIVTWSPSS